MTPESPKNLKLEEIYSKIVSPEVALLQVRKWQNKDLQVAITDVVVDLPTYLHKEYFLAIKTVCDKLLVRIDTDEHVKSKKGPNRPNVILEYREKETAHCSSVDLITTKSSGTLEWIKYYRPNMIIKSTTSGIKLIQEIEELQELAKSIDLELKILVLDERSNEVPLEFAKTRALEYDNSKFKEGVFSGSVIERKIRDDALLSNQQYLSCDLPELLKNNT